MRQKKEEKTTSKITTALYAKETRQKEKTAVYD